MAHAYYYLKAILAALSSGIIYLSSFLGTDFSWADLGHVSVGHWFGFLTAVFGVGGLTAVASNGPKPLTSADKKSISQFQAPVVADTPLIPRSSTAPAKREQP